MGHSLNCVVAQGQEQRCSACMGLVDLADLHLLHTRAAVSVIGTEACCCVSMSRSSGCECLVPTGFCWVGLALGPPWERE